MVKFGIISDTHIDKLREKEIQSVLQELETIFIDVDRIIHAGDIGSKRVLQTLQNIAPVTYVLGENDIGFESETFLTITTQEFSKPIGVIHRLPEDLNLFCEKNKLIDGILIFGHTHKPLIKGTEYNVLLLNPGSPTMPEAPNHIKGFEKPLARPSVMKLSIENGIVTTFIINLKYEL
jgi:hypothetical protein